MGLNKHCIDVRIIRAFRKFVRVSKGIKQEFCDLFFKFNHPLLFFDFSLVGVIKVNAIYPNAF